MNASTIERTQQQLKAYYEQMRNDLLYKNNYLYRPDLTNVTRYFHFLEASLQQPYNRVAHLAAFIHDQDGLMSSRMYPLGFLLPDTRAKIYTYYREVEQMMDSIEVSIEEAFQAFEKEPYQE